jgi:hypothetical protein
VFIVADGRIVEIDAWNTTKLSPALTASSLARSIPRCCAESAVCEVIQGDQAAVVFYPEPPAAWGGVMAARVVGHFRVFGLARLYGAQAAVELQNIRLHLRKLLTDAGPAGVRAHLFVVAESCEQVRVKAKENHRCGSL